MATTQVLQQQRDSTTRIEVAFMFDRYIGLPYWPERNFLIEIGKGVHAKLGESKKLQARTAILAKLGKTMEDYEHAVVRANRPFYTTNDTDPDRGDGEIIIPARHFLAFLNHTSMECPRVVPKISNKGMTFIGVKFFGPVEGLVTGKTVADAQSFARFVKMPESNQRLFSETPYISNFVARAILSVDREVIQPEDLCKLVEWGGKWIGIGGARPQGYGRFTVAEWTIL